MSVARQCAVCGELEPIRYNFGSDYKAEIKFHKEKYYCNKHSKTAS